MAKDKRSKPEDPTPDLRPATPDEEPGAPFDSAEPGTIPNHRRCPSCWGGSGGIGTCYSSHNRVRSYKCGNCGFTWSVPIELKIHEPIHRPVELRTREEPEDAS